eukprot:4223543-Alexandrium_andersonii.AAC.1
MAAPFGAFCVFPRSPCTSALFRFGAMPSSQCHPPSVRFGPCGGSPRMAAPLGAFMSSRARLAHQPGFRLVPCPGS